MEEKWTGQEKAEEKRGKVTASTLAGINLREYLLTVCSSIVDAARTTAAPLEEHLITWISASATIYPTRNTPSGIDSSSASATCCIIA